jgi:hypothetical protein
MIDKTFLRQKIALFFGEDIDPDKDEQVVAMLRSKFNIRLPQRTQLNAALQASASTHAVIELLLDYRSQ